MTECITSTYYKELPTDNGSPQLQQLYPPPEGSAIIGGDTARAIYGTSRVRVMSLVNREGTDLPNGSRRVQLSHDLGSMVVSVEDPETAGAFLAETVEELLGTGGHQIILERGRLIEESMIPNLGQQL